MDKKIKNILKQETRIPDSIMKQMEDTLYHLPELEQVSKRGNIRFFFNQSYIKAAAIALLCILSLGTTAYAAAKYFGLMDFLSSQGMNDTDTTKKLMQEELTEQVYSVSNEYATYSLKEAICDSELIYMVIEVSPKSESYMLVPEYCMPEDTITALSIDGLTEGTIGEYAGEHGKEIVYVGMGLFKDEELVSCTEDARGNTEGKLYCCLTATNGFNVNEMTLKFMGTAHLGTAQTVEDISRCNLEVTLNDYSNKESKIYSPVMENVWSDSNINLEQIEITETELGVYATYLYQAEKDMNITFILSDKEGNKFDFMPYYINGGEEVMDDGCRKVTYAYQKPENVNELQLWVNGLGEKFDSIPIKLICQE